MINEKVESQKPTTKVYDTIFDSLGNPLCNKVISFESQNCNSSKNGLIIKSKTNVFTDEKGYFEINLIADIVYRVCLPQGNSFQFLLPLSEEPIPLSVLFECAGLDSRSAKFLATIEYLKKNPEQLSLDFTVEKSAYHLQSIPSSTWMVNHNLGKKPHVTAYDTEGKPLWGTIDYRDENNLTFNFVPATAGELFLN